jgi:hypothetical protein
MEKKIYISLKETENFVFNKIIIIPARRLQIERAQKDWSIDVKVDLENIIEYNDLVFLVAGAIKNFEIPADEENLFLNHFRVPKGLTTPISRRDFRDSKEDTSKIKFSDDVDYTQDIRLFKHLRRGFIQCYALALNDSVSKDFTSEAINFLNEIEKMSEFNTEFIKAILLNDVFPIKERNDGNFYPEAVNRFNWLGAYLFSKFPGIKDFSKNDIEEAKEWLLNFKDKENIVTIKKAIANPPDVFFEEFEFLMGYYFAASYFEEASIALEYYKIIIEQLNNVKLEKNNKVIFWAVFFQAIFKDNLDFLYVIKSAQKQQKNLELKLLTLVFPEIVIGIKKLEKVNTSQKQALAEIFQLENGGKYIEPTFINKDEKKQLFYNSFSNNMSLNIGFEISQNSGLNVNLFSNYCTFNNLGFSLSLNNNPSDVTFFIKEKSEAKKWLKGLKLKTKQIAKLIDVNKKALVGFLKLSTYESGLFKVYEWILNNSEKKINFKTIVIVLLLDDDIEYVQSPEFQKKKLDIEKFCKTRFGNNTFLLIKNKRVKSEGEIKRNLKLLLESYSVNDIELINENIDDMILNWILSINNEYVVESKAENYYTLIN